MGCCTKLETDEAVIQLAYLNARTLDFDDQVGKFHMRCCMIIKKKTGEQQNINSCCFKSKLLPRYAGPLLVMSTQ